MSAEVVRSLNSPWLLLVLAILLAGSSFLLQSRTGINLGDEGFLWYGVQQTARGAVPLRDFQSYDPGRYYWSAVGTFLFGKGLVALRLSETLFQIIGLWVGLLAASRVAHDWALLAAIAVLLIVWMVPSHKLFDHTLLLCGIWVAVRLIEEPSTVRIFTAGVFLGVCVFFGKNHALYNLLAQAFLLLFLYCKLRPLFSASHLGLWIAGIVLGLLPLIVMCACVSGFSASYIESIRSLFRHGTNLALPVPWPWRVSPYSVNAMQFLLGILLIVLPIGYIAAIIVSFFMRSQTIHDHALFIGCGFIGLFYLHHAFSRADFSHLAQVIHPFTLAALAMPFAVGEHKLWRWAAVATLIVVALFTVGKYMPLYQRLTSSQPWTTCGLGEKILVAPSTNRLLTCLRKFAAENIALHDPVLIAPFLPGLYPILHRASPLWDLAYYFPAEAQRQEAMIQELAVKNVNWAIIADTSLGSREDLRFSATHHLVWQYLMENFEPVEDACVPKSMTILHRKHQLASH